MKKMMITVLAAAMMLIPNAVFAAETAAPSAFVCPGGNAVCSANGACVNDGQCANAQNSSCPGSQASSWAAASEGNPVTASETPYVCPNGNAACVSNGACMNDGQCQNKENCPEGVARKCDGNGYRDGGQRRTNHGRSSGGHHGGNRSR